MQVVSIGKTSLQAGSGRAAGGPRARLLRLSLQAMVTHAHTQQQQQAAKGRLMGTTVALGRVDGAFRSESVF